MSAIRTTLLALLFALTLAACATAPPDGIRPVSSFEINRYLGQWYEIARLDHAFERGMSDVNATYELQDDGSVKTFFVRCRSLWIRAESGDKYHRIGFQFSGISQADAARIRKLIEYQRSHGARHPGEPRP